MAKRTYSNFLLKLRKTSPTTIFWVTIIVLAFIYNFNHIIFSRPIGIHQWRNCVSAGYALNYYHGADFFKPKTEAFITKENRSNVFVLECPVLYYTVGLLYKTFGYQEFLYRLFNTLIGFLGLLYLFKTAKLMLNNVIISLVAPLILFTSTVYIFYMSNFIPDATALAIALIAFYFFYRYYVKPKYKYLIFSMLLFSLAGLLKVQSLYLYFALFGVFFIELIFSKNFGIEKKRLFPKPTKAFLIFMIVLVINFAWYYYGQLIAQEYGFSSSSRIRSAIWFLESEEIAGIWDLFVRRFKAGYFHSPLFIYFTFALFVLNLIFYRKTKVLFNVITILLFVQIIIFNIFFFESIGRCDYYNINSLVFPVFVFLNAFHFLKNHFPKIYQSKYFKIGLSILMILLVISGKRGIKEKYKGWFYKDSKPIVEKCGYITPYLRQLGIERDDKVYYTPDPSINISLYLMDQLGNTDFGAHNHYPFEKQMDYLKRRDIKYIMIGDDEIHENWKEKHPKFINEDKKVGEFNGVYIYSLMDKFTSVHCNAEIISDDGNFLLSTDKSVKFKRAHLRSDKQSYSGEYSIKLDAENQFGFSHRINYIKPGNKYKISVYKKGDVKRLFLVAASVKKHKNKFYVQTNKVIKKQDNGWQLIELVATIPEDFPGYAPLGVYVWNDSEETVYIDDLKIEKL